MARGSGYDADKAEEGGLVFIQFLSMLLPAGRSYGACSCLYCFYYKQNTPTEVCIRKNLSISFDGFGLSADVLPLALLFCI